MPKYAVDLNEPRLARCSEVFRLDAKEINKFYDVYKKLDKTRAEVIPSDVFFAGFHHKEGTQIGDALLELIDVDNSDQLTFPEFVQLVCTFAFFEEAEVLRLCFFVLDATKRGHCRPDELEYFLLKLWDDDDSRLAEHIDFAKIDVDHDGRLQFREFKLMHQKNPKVLYPAFKMQADLKIAFLGNSFWKAKKFALRAETEPP